jgi:hypothetical protein
MNWLSRLLKLPSPVDLGWSNALGSRHFHVAPGQKTWEDYIEHLKATFPIRAFIAITLYEFLYYTVWCNIKHPFIEVHYWLVSHIIPSRRYHMLDLRQPNGYRYGWQDIDHRLVYAMFNLLNLFVEKEDRYCPTEEDVAAEPHLKAQRDACHEIQAIYTWWNVDRIAAEKAIENEQNRLYGDWALRSLPTSDERAALYKMETDLDAKTEEMMIRLVKVRGWLWT